jgi:hypothetical protein
MISKVEIQQGPDGKGSIIVDGQDVSEKVSGVAYEGKVGSVPQVHLTLVPDAELEIQGEVFVHSLNDREAVMKSLEQWLRTRDPQAIETEALSRMGLSESGPFSARVLEVLADMVVAANGSSN